jgi:hypothetical protein
MVNNAKTKKRFVMGGKLMEKMKRKIWVLAVLLFLSLAVGAKGDEMADLKQQMDEQSKKLQELQEKLEKMESQQGQQDKVIQEAVSKAFEDKKADIIPDSLKWAEKIKFSGDFRYRFESIDAKASSGGNLPGNNKNRIRARLGLDAKINEEVNVGFRFATGSDTNPNSTNQTLDNGFAKKDVWLDLAYFDWHPKSVEGLNVYGGKMPRPFYRVGDNQLVWDDDVNPEGIAAKYVLPLTKNDKLYINGGGFWLKEDVGAAGSSNQGAGLWEIQSCLKHEFENKDYLLGGVSYDAFSNLNGKNTLFNTANGYGNTVNTVGGKTYYTMDYDVFECFGEYGTTVGSLPVSVYGNYAKNTSAKTSQDTGWLIGATLNKAKDPGSWELGYNYRDVEKDAVLGLLTDSDFVGGGTNGKGHTFSGKYQWTRNIQTALTYIASERGDSKSDYRRLMADIIFKF